MKNWNNISDDELDKLFRQANYKESDSFEAEAWSKMKQLLDENEPANKPVLWKKNAFLILALLLLTGVGVGYNFIKNMPNKTENEKVNSNLKTTINQNTKITETNNQETNINPTAKETKLNIETSAISNENSSEKIVAEKQKLSEETKLNIVNKTTNRTKQFNSKIETEKANQNTLLKENQGQKPSRLNSNSNNKKIENRPNNFDITAKNFSSETNSAKLVVELNTESKAKNIEKKEKNNLNLAQVEFDPSLETSKNSPTVVNRTIGNQLTGNNLQNSNIETINNSEIIKTELQQFILATLFAKPTNFKAIKFTKNIEIQKTILPAIVSPIYFKKGLYFRANVSPDVSTVGSNEIGKIGSNFGGFLEYRFSKRLSLQAGVFRSIKHYDAYPEQYDWVWGKPPTPLVEIVAECKMIDYPINIRYDITQNTKSRLFSSVGLTTYKMMEETYDYDYEDNTNPNIRWRHWSRKTGDTYLTSNLNLSLGFEKQIAKKISMQVEPFAKVPLKSIGFGKVPLISYGLMFSGKMPIFIQKK